MATKKKVELAVSDTPNTAKAQAVRVISASVKLRNAKTDQFFDNNPKRPTIIEDLNAPDQAWVRARLELGILKLV